jgi:1-acyl-sn-glycerol-3-phosphate acyltransferase
MNEALDGGASLIIFPEGTRGAGWQVQQFKTGIFYLAKSRPKAELVPVWIDNAYRVLPKGIPLPAPLLCSVAFGKPMQLEPGEDKTEFLERLRKSLQDLAAT